ncbi:MAG TPA: 16S rRNA (uracil(1498)-N(3))-methyltransferase [Clostridiales bacterium]|nr:16S rRNA (uracil(1498)-N(3))-methyltransferase [Clostridiales bacterium]
MPRFFVAASNIGNGAALLTGSDAQHVKVLRMKLGERLVICDGNGTDHHCRITKLGDGHVEAEILETRPCPAEPTVKCTVLAGFPKGERSDYLVQKCTEVGASEIIFFVSKRCVSRPDGKGLAKKLTRWQRIAEEAAKQSGRGIIPRVSALGSFVEALDKAVKSDLALFMYETGQRISLRQALEAAGRIKSVSVITGPEGGFEQHEADIAAAAGLKLCSMGERILRCETAPVVALSAIMYATDNL